jgi:hypothetical protein
MSLFNFIVLICIGVYCEIDSNVVVIIAIITGAAGWIVGLISIIISCVICVKYCKKGLINNFL